MIKRNASPSKRPQMQWIVADVCDLTPHFADNSFDFILDKTTIDSIACGPKNEIRVAQMLRECQRVLRVQSGAYFGVQISAFDYTDHFQRPHLHIDFSSEELEQGGTAYTFWKKPHADLVAQANWGLVEAQLGEEQADQRGERRYEITDEYMLQAEITLLRASKVKHFEIRNVHIGLCNRQEEHVFIRTIISGQS